MNFAQIAMLVYSALMLVGGVMGYTQAKSVWSLIVGIASSIILDVAFVLTKQSGRNGYLLGSVTAFALAAFFVYRIVDTGKFMPAGGLCALSVVAGIVILMGAGRIAR